MERIRPDRNSQHAKLPIWSAQNEKNMAYVVTYTEDYNMFESETDGMTSRMALRKILQLFETHKYQECSILVNKMSNVTLRSILKELPIDVIIDSLPMSLGIIEALYSKSYFLQSKNFPLKDLRPQEVLNKIVNIFATYDDIRLAGANGSHVNDVDLFIPTCQNIIRIISLVQPCLRREIAKNKANLDHCLEKLGSHGCVASSESKLMSLHEALKIEFSKTMQMYKNALQKLEDLSLANRHVRKLSAKGGTPSSSSHQRLLQISQSEVQDRLIKNKSLLNVVEPTINNCFMSNLLQILEARIETDKTALFHFSELRKDMRDTRQIEVISAYFQTYSTSYARVLGMFQDVAGDDESLVSDSSSISDDFRRSSASSQMLKHRYSSNPDLSFVERNREVNSSGSQSLSPSKSKDNLNAKASQQSKNNTSWLPSQQVVMATRSLSQDAAVTEVDSLKNEIETLKKELEKSRETITKYQEREKILRDRLAEQAQKQLEKGTKFEDLNLGDGRPTQLIRAYGNLYSEIRLDALDALDSLNDLADFDDLKGKLLFSVVVLSFRSAQQKFLELKTRIHNLLYMNNGGCNQATPDPVVKEMEQMIDSYLRKSVENYDITTNFEEVSTQIFSTLYDYPDLQSCEGLRYYIEECVRLAWKLNAQNPPLVIEFDSTKFSSDKHTRFHESDSESTEIKSYLWPSLLEGENGVCVHKGVVIT